MARQVEAARRFPDGFRIITAQVSVALYQGQMERAKELTAQFASEATVEDGAEGAGGEFVEQRGAVGRGRTAMRRRRGTGFARRRRSNGMSARSSTARLRFAVIKDVAEAKKMADAARQRPEASIEEIEIGLRLCDAMIAMRRGERGAIDAMPVPKEDNTDGRWG